MKLFAGTSNPNLARAIADKLSLPLGKIDIIRFADSESRVRIEEEVESNKVAVIQSLSNPVDTNLMELALIGDALRQADVEKMIAVVPYLGYSRQDRAHRIGEAVSARVAAKIIQAANFTKVITIDIHSESVIGFYQIPVINLFGLSLFTAAVPKEEVVIVSPDAGGMKRAQRFAESIDAPLCFIEKKRNLEKIHTTEVVRVIGDVEGKNAVIVDDIVTSGGTLVKASYLLQKEGARSVIAFVTHPVFTATTATIIMDSPLERVYTTDTVVIPPEWRFPKLTIISVAPLLAEAIK